jgi:riboflavin synthase
VQVLWPPHEGLNAPLSLGDSVAVDGVCLTVADLLPHGFRADVSDETLARSTLAAKAQRGEPVNLEPALRLADRLGGHLVSGHVDGLGQVDAIARAGESWRLELSWIDRHYGRYVCDKASVAVNGISLTVAGSEDQGCRFWIAVIPHTWSRTTLHRLEVGQVVNLEADLLAKYAERLLQPTADSAANSKLDQAWLQDHGWS